MKFIVENPFRVLGLPATASSRDIAKRVSDLETFIELGKAKTYETDLPSFGALSRTVDSVKTAAQQIEQAESKLFHSFFWFRSGNDADVRALQAVANLRYDDALAIWDLELKQREPRRYTSRINRAVLRLWLATKNRLDQKMFGDALVEVGFAIDEDLDDSIGDVLGPTSSGLNKVNLWNRVIDAFLQVAQAAPERPYGTNALQIVYDCWSFPPESLNYITTKVINPVIERIEGDVNKSMRQRSEAVDTSNLNSRNGLADAESLILELKELLGVDDARFQAIANKLADEACSCAITAHNKYKDVKLSSMLIDWAAKLPSFGSIDSRIRENKETIDGSVKHAERTALFEPILVKLKITIATVEHAGIHLDEVKQLLLRIRTALGREDEEYVQASSACVNQILGYLIDRVNVAQDSHRETHILAKLSTTIDKATDTTRRLLGLDMDSETRTRVQKNLSVIEGIQSQIRSVQSTKSATASNSAASQSFFDQIPGWLWIVGLIFLLSMCAK